VGKTRAATGQGSVESSARADRVEKEGDGLHEGKGRDSRRHKVGSMFVRLRMNRAVVGDVSKKSSMCQHSFFNFNLNIHIECLLDTRYNTGSTYKFNVS
jgi:hypothetical protein